MDTKKWFEEVVESVKEISMGKKDGEVLPTLFFLKKEDGKEKKCVAGLDPAMLNPEVKHLTIAMMKHMLDMEDAFAYVFFSETWGVKSSEEKSIEALLEEREKAGGRFENMLDERIEFSSFMSESREPDGFYAQRVLTLEIKRDETGHVCGFEKDMDSEVFVGKDAHVESVFLGMLPR